MAKKALVSPPSNVNVQRARLKFVNKYLSLTVERLSFVDERPIYIYIYIYIYTRFQKGFHIERYIDR